jgi:hypothetical protein
MRQTKISLLVFVYGMIKKSNKNLTNDLNQPEDLYYDAKK